MWPHAGHARAEKPRHQMPCVFRPSTWSSTWRAERMRGARAPEAREILKGDAAALVAPGGRGSHAVRGPSTGEARAPIYKSARRPQAASTAPGGSSDAARRRPGCLDGSRLRLGQTGINHLLRGPGVPRWGRRGPQPGAAGQAVTGYRQVRNSMLPERLWSVNPATSDAFPVPGPTLGASARRGRGSGPWGSSAVPGWSGGCARARCPWTARWAARRPGFTAGGWARWRDTFCFEEAPTPRPSKRDPQSSLTTRRASECPPASSRRK
jgi:hypothetical protein